MLFFLIPVLIIILTIFDSYSGIEINKLETVDFQYIKQISRMKDLSLISSSDYLIASFLILWLIVFFIYYILSLIKGTIKLKQLIKNSQIIEEKITNQILTNIKKEFRIKKSVTIYRSQLIWSPFLTGIKNPKIILPYYNFNNHELKMILRHELLHFKRNDLIFKHILHFITKVYWFNPIIYLYAEKFHEITELVCDEKSTLAFTKEQKAQYASLLINIAKSSPQHHSLIIFFTNKNFNFLKRRIENIMKKSEKRSVTMIIAMIALVVSSPFMTYASAEGTMHIQKELVTEYISKNSTLIPSTPINCNELFIIDKTSSAKEIYYISTLDARGANLVDFWIDATGEAQFSPLTLKKGANIRISIIADNKNDIFKVGIIHSGKRSYINSTNGMASHDFEITTDGEYIVYVEGNNNSNDIHLTGSINVTEH